MGGGGSTYDYGFRIYNPQIAKFLSVDPLTKEYPWYTPYQFASNTPIAAIDRDGLEAEITINSPWFHNQIQEALDAGDIERAQILALASINANRPAGDYAEKVYKGAATAGTFNYNESNPNVLTVFDSDGKEMLKVVKVQDPPKIIERDKGTWQRIKDFFKGDWSGKERITQPGGIHFYAEGAQGETRTDATSGEVSNVDITWLYTYLTTTKFGPDGIPKATIPDVVKNIIDQYQAWSEILQDNSPQKTYPTPSQYVEPDHDGNSGGNYITPDSSLYEKRTYDKSGKQVSKDTIDTSKERMK